MLKKRNFEKKREREEIEVSVLLLIKITGNTRKLLSINETLNPLIKEESTHPREITLNLSLSLSNRRSGKAARKEEKKEGETYKNSCYLPSSNLPEGNLISLSCSLSSLARHSTANHYDRMFSYNIKSSWTGARAHAALAGHSIIPLNPGG